MGKTKKRTLNRISPNVGEFSSAVPTRKRVRCTSFTEGISRRQALDFICYSLKKNLYDPRICNLMTLFGFNAEELSEAGVSYEDIKAFSFFLK